MLLRKRPTIAATNIIKIMDDGKSPQTADIGRAPLVNPNLMGSKTGYGERGWSVTSTNMIFGIFGL